MDDAMKKMPRKMPRGTSFGDKPSGESSYMRKMPRKNPRGVPFSEAVGADNKVRMKDADDRAAKFRTDAMMEEGYKKGGKIKEYGGKEVYKSKAAKARHEKAESPAKERSEKRGYAKGGSVDGCATRGKTKGRMV